MFKSFAFSPKDLLLVAAGAFIIYLLFFRNTGQHTTVKESQSINIKNVTESAVNMDLDLPVPQPAIVYRDRIVEVASRKDVKPIDTDKLRILNKYRDTARLKNATVYSEILTDGHIYSNKVTADVAVTTITNTIEKETVRYPSALYFSPEVNFMPGTSFIQSAGIGINYINKTNFGIGAKVNYNFNQKALVYGLNTHIKLF